MQSESSRLTAINISASRYQVDKLDRKPTVVKLISYCRCRRIVGGRYYTSNRIIQVTAGTLAK